MKRLMTSLCPLLLAVAAPAAAAEPTRIPGGQLDPSVVGVDAYAGVPQSADPGSNRACQLAQTYVGLFQAGKFSEVPNLFVPDAVILDPLRVSVNGHVNIADFYGSKVGGSHPQVIAVSYVGQGDTCMLEMAVRMKVGNDTRYVLQTIDHFTINQAGKFSGMFVFMRPTPSGAALPAPGH